MHPVWHWVNIGFLLTSVPPALNLVWFCIGSPLAIPIKFLSPDPNFSWWVRPSEFILFCASYLASAVYVGAGELCLGVFGKHRSLTLVQ